MAGLWLVGEVVNHVGLYGSKVAEGCSAFQRRSCWLCYHHRIIMKISGLITKDQGKVHAKGQGQRSKVKVTEVTTQLNHFRTVTPVWIHIWWWNDAYSLIMLRRGALLFFKVIRQISRSHGSKNHQILPRLGVSRLLLQFEFTNGRAANRYGNSVFCTDFSHKIRQYEMLSLSTDFWVFK